MSINNVSFDDRWVGENGIGRFAKELSIRLNFEPMHLKRSPTSWYDFIYLSFKLAKRNNLTFSPGYNAPILFNDKYIFTIHDLNHLEFGTNFIKKIYFTIVIKYAARRSLAILTVSEFSKKRIISWAKIPEHRVINVGNGVSTIFNNTGPRYESKEPYILCVSNRKPHKNEFRALSAFAKSNINSKTLILFTGAKTIELEAHADALKIKDRVKFLGCVDDDLLAKLYRGATALLFPSLYEGFGFPIIEAMACGTPVITSNITSMPEISDGAAHLVDPYDVDDIAYGINRVLSDEAYRLELINSGLQRSKIFNWDIVAKNVTKALSYF